MANIKVLNALLVAYQMIASPVLKALGCGCRFYPSCSAYAIEAVNLHPWHKALFLAFKRILRCGPWHPGGLDVVPRRIK